jgi:hypothetical protein
MFTHKVIFGDGHTKVLPRKAAQQAMAFSEDMSLTSVAQLMDRMEASVQRDPKGPAVFTGTGSRTLEVWFRSASA